MNPLAALLFREVEPVRRKCIRCGAELLLVRDHNDKRVALDARPAGEGYHVPMMVRMRWPPRSLVAGAFKQEYHVSHADTCEARLKKLAQRSRAEEGQ